MFKNIFKKTTFVSPVAGTIKNIKDVADDSFAQKMLGDGFAITPEGNQIKSPVNGEVVFVFDTKHAIGLKASDGLEILIHVGVDTVSLKGEGFSTHVKNNQKVKQGDVLLTVDFDKIQSKVPSTDVIVVFSNGETCTVHEPGKTVTELEKDVITVK
ncbi:PTS glucose transporter subunit IIA [Gracilibacillus sp. S3-1-1]|uniref:PTS glucose transporter subunit IIA n=1 Tax=Gracilibacillus pellucidus TaxID=3095368 RepID=A0ACC6M8T4_9BACI|nr:PTS glucose transporter subunit IIA [Gracilibacillus sp. S3-1-1]MDX8047276.1 PTS glucose transporter subunit IIA [Gracilibacillus sp. S3-1-1]